ncbi:enterochelin esterase [Marinomonas polaris]|uniref:enterochelin esterase n=1 Tax=Marinomonas polaris TaxID=293552 RepID=UPI003F98B5E3
MQKIQPINPLFHHQDVGSHEWWQDIKQAGTPLIVKVDENKSLVSFIWRDPDGKRSDIDTVYIDIYSKTPHPTQQLTGFTRLKGSDVWFWETELENDWLGSYFLMPATHNQRPPLHKNHQYIRRWWIQLMGLTAQSDPLNLLPAHSNGNGITLSALCLSEDKKNTFKYSNVETQGILKECIWQSERLTNERRIWLYRTSNNTQESLPVVLLFDGQYWANHLPIYAELDGLTLSSQLPKAQYVFIDSINASHRNIELACNTDFWIAIQKELLPWVNTQYPITDKPEKTIVAGQSLGGLCAIFGAFHWPEYFATAISQSGSFWWPDVDSQPGEGELIQKISNADLTTAQLNIVMEAGCYEKDMLEVSQIMAKTLKRNGHRVRYREFRGGHDWLCWRQGLIHSLLQALNS